LIDLLITPKLRRVSFKNNALGITSAFFCVAYWLLINSAYASESLVAKRITVENAADTIKTGPDAIGGIGDWYLSNGTLCAVVSDIEHESELSSRGGVLIDLGFCARADDHYISAQDVLDGKRTRPVDISVINTDSDSRTASIITSGMTEGVQVETRYSLDLQNPTQLKISKTVRRLDDSEPGFNIYTPITFNYRSLEAFTYSSIDPGKSKGFSNEEFVSRGVTSLKTAARNVDMIILLGPADAEQPISYGWQLRSAQRRSADQSYAVPYFALADRDSAAMLVLVDDFWIGDGTQIGLLQLPQISLMSLDEDDVLELEEVIYVGDSADVASITDQLYAGDPLVSARSTAPDSALHIDTVAGDPLTHVRADEEGNFELNLPAGQYRVRHYASAERAASHRITVGEKGLDLGDLPLTEVAKLRLPREQAMRLVFVGQNGTASPNFVDSLTQYSVLDAQGIFTEPRVAQIFLAGVESDQSVVDLPAGEYLVYASKGPEYSLESTELKLVAGETATLNISEPRREIATPGYIAADFHVHAGSSMDNTFSDMQRVRTFVAEHGEIMVSTEHDVAIDFSPLIESMGVGDKIISMVGTEVTSSLPNSRLEHTGGHVNYFPFVIKENQFRDGVVNHEGRRLREVMHEMRSQNPGVIVQLNHPRKNLALSGELPKDYKELIDRGAYLDHMGVAAYPYNPAKSLQTEPNSTLIEPDPETGVRDVDFDAMEIVNPGGGYHNERIAAVRKDWLSFLLQGEKIVGTANSDSHKSSEQVAVPRNMVAIANDDIASFDQLEFLAAIQAGNLFGTTGPMLNVTLGGVPMGGTFQGDKALVEINVDSVDWIPVSRVVVQVNGQDVEEFDASTKKTFTLELEFDADAFVTIEVHGTATQEYQHIYPEIEPYAFSNPIYVDSDADGRWQAPGL